MEFTQVFLHTLRLKLECTDGTSLLIELVGLGVVDGDGIEVDINASCAFDVGTGLLQLRECLQAEEIHLDKSRRLDDVSVVLRAVGLHALEVRVVSG